jgi:hypothetical protein
VSETKLLKTDRSKLNIQILHYSSFRFWVSNGKESDVADGGTKVDGIPVDVVVSESDTDSDDDNIPFSALAKSRLPNNFEPPRWRKTFSQEHSTKRIFRTIGSLIDGHLRKRTLRARIKEICNIAEPVQPRNETHGRCQPLRLKKKKNRKTRYNCKTCNKFLYLEHMSVNCEDCYEGLVTEKKRSFIWPFTDFSFFFFAIC